MNQKIQITDIDKHSPLSIFSKQTCESHLKTQKHYWDVRNVAIDVIG